MNLYCVHLAAVNPKTGELQRVVVNDVPAMHDDEARDAAISRLLEVSPQTSGIRYIRARRTDDAWWNRDTHWDG